MRFNKFAASLLITAALASTGPLASAEGGQSQQVLHPQSHPEQHEHQPMPDAPADTRVLVELPEMMRRHMLANMRDHLRALHEIQDALARNALDEAAEIAEQRLGMTSLERHGARHMAPYMPEEMRSIGTGMHRAASQLAMAASDAAVTGDVKPALAALARVTAQCVACHEGFRVR